MPWHSPLQSLWWRKYADSEASTCVRERMREREKKQVLITHISTTWTFAFFPWLRGAWRREPEPAQHEVGVWHRGTLYSPRSFFLSERPWNTPERKSRSEVAARHPRRLSRVCCRDSGSVLKACDLLVIMRHLRYCDGPEAPYVITLRFCGDSSLFID